MPQRGAHHPETPVGAGRTALRTGPQPRPPESAVPGPACGPTARPHRCYRSVLTESAVSASAIWLSVFPISRNSLATRLRTFPCTAMISRSTAMSC